MFTATAEDYDEVVNIPSSLTRGFNLTHANEVVFDKKCFIPSDFLAQTQISGTQNG